MINTLKLLGLSEVMNHMRMAGDLESGHAFDKHIEREWKRYEQTKNLPRKKKKKVRKEILASIELYKQLNQPILLW